MFILQSELIHHVSYLQWENGTKRIQVRIHAHKVDRGEMQFRSQAGVETHTGQGMGLLGVGIEVDAERVLRHGHNEFLVGAQSRPLGRL